MAPPSLPPGDPAHFFSETWGLREGIGLALGSWSGMGGGAEGPSPKPWVELSRERGYTALMTEICLTWYKGLGKTSWRRW